MRYGPVAIIRCDVGLRGYVVRLYLMGYAWEW
jgi:hypothetical protein